MAIPRHKRRDWATWLEDRNRIKRQRSSSVVAVVVAWEVVCRCHLEPLAACWPADRNIRHSVVVVDSFQPGRNNSCPYPVPGRFEVRLPSADCGWPAMICFDRTGSSPVRLDRDNYRPIVRWPCPW